MITDIEPRVFESGRIRIGQQVPTSNGKTRPAKLENFRLTSGDKGKLDKAAELWGGEVKNWEGSPNGKQWELITESNDIPVIVPPAQMAFSQWYETWSGGGCLRRCDGNWESLSDSMCPCKSEAERSCKAHSRLSLILPDLDGIGLWRLDSQGFYAAAELAGTVQLIQNLGLLLEATLRLQQRSSKKDGKTVRYAVPTLDINMPPRELIKLTNQVAMKVLPQFSAHAHLSHDVRGQMWALAHAKGLTDHARHRLSEGQSWSEEGTLSNADAQRIMGLMRAMPDVKTIEAGAAVISPETHPNLYRPATSQETAEGLTDEVWDALHNQANPGKDAHPENEPVEQRPFVCRVQQKGRPCVRTTPHVKGHAFEEHIVVEQRGEGSVAGAQSPAGHDDDYPWPGGHGPTNTPPIVDSPTPVEQPKKSAESPQPPKGGEAVGSPRVGAGSSPEGKGKDWTGFWAAACSTAKVWEATILLTAQSMPECKGLESLKDLDPQSAGGKMIERLLKDAAKTEGSAA